MDLNMKKLHIIGAGGLAKEILSYIIGEENKRYQIIGCWAENQFNNDKYAQFYSGNFDKFKKEYNCEEYVLMAVANSKIRRKIIEETLVNLDINYENYIHPSCNVSTFSDIGKGCILAPQTIICADAVLKDYNFLNTECVVGHDTTLGDYCTLFPKVEICGDCFIETGCTFGIGSIVTPGVIMKENSKLDAMSVLRENYNMTAMFVGTPAKPVRVYKDYG